MSICDKVVSVKRLRISGVLEPPRAGRGQRDHLALDAFILRENRPVHGQIDILAHRRVVFEPSASNTDENTQRFYLIGQEEGRPVFMPQAL